LTRLVGGSPDLQLTLNKLVQEALLDISDEPETARTQLNEYTRSDEGRKKLKKCLGVMSLLAYQGNRQFQNSLRRFLNLLPPIDGPEGPLNHNNPAFEEYCHRMDELPLYGYPFWGAYCIEGPHWRTQAEIYAPMCAAGTNLEHIPRFAMVARKILMHNQQLMYQGSLARLKVQIADEHMSNYDEDRACLVYRELQNLPLVEVLRSAFDVYCHHFLFPEALQLCKQFMNSQIVKVKCIDACLHLENSPDRVLQLINLLESILQEFGKEETLKESIPPTTLHGFIPKKSVVFLKTCFEVLLDPHRVDDLLNELSAHIQNINYYFLKVTLIDKFEDEENTPETPFAGLYKLYCQHSVISRVLEVFSHIGYVNLKEDTKQNLLSQLKPTFTALTSFYHSDFGYYTSLRQSLLRYDSLLLKIFKTDKEADQNYKKLRVFIGIDLSEVFGIDSL
jgi:hypothetical protein